MSEQRPSARRFSELLAKRGEMVGRQCQNCRPQNPVSVSNMQMLLMDLFAWADALGIGKEKLDGYIQQARDDYKRGV